MGEQQRHILSPFAQGRQNQVDDVEAVIEVLAEAAFADKGQELDIGSSDDAHVHFDLFGAAEAHELALLNDAEQLCLRLGADGGDFVEEDRALVRDFKEALLGGNGARESALHVAEELRLEKIHGDGAGVDGDEGLIGPW